MTSQELRQKYLNFFVKRGHKIIPSAPLIPENDATTLFVSSGMQPLLPYFLGERHPLGKKLVNIQLCFRGHGLHDDDTQEVGDTRHTTFFEMEGNWSLGAYFKEEQLSYFFTFLTDPTTGLGLDPRKLYVTVFAGDKIVAKDVESIKIWQKLFAQKGLKAKEGDRIVAYGVEKNWWSRSGMPDQMPVGEIGGPDSEVFYDFGLPHNSKFGPTCHPNCECGRFLEIGNSVFMQYQKQVDNSFKELTQKSVDFGGGLIRQLAAVRNDPDVFQTDLFVHIIQSIEKVTGKNYQDNRVAMRIIADHLTAASFLVKSGIIPANKGQGYVLRRLIRRALIKVRQLKTEINEIEVKLIIEAVLNTYVDLYFNLEDRQVIKDEISNEIFKFKKALDKGLQLVAQKTHIDGRMTFDLYQTYGFPWELTIELAAEKGQKIDRGEFEREFEKHRQSSRSASAGMFRGGLQDQNVTTTKYHTATHLLQAALRHVLNYPIHQEGSNITVSRARFDFNCAQKLTEVEIAKIEKFMNQKIKENWPVSYVIKDKDEAIKQGASAFFPEKYPQRVKVYTIGTFSTELCGGPHVGFTGEIGAVKIIKQESIGTGRRRLYLQLTAQNGSSKNF